MPQHQTENFNRGYPFSFNGFHSFFREAFGRTLTLSKNIVELNYESYKRDYFSASDRKPILILVYVDGCMMCNRIIPLWNQLADNLTPLGVVVARCNLARDIRFQEALNTVHVPTLLAVVNFKISFFSSSVLNQASLIAFLRTYIMNSNPAKVTNIPSLFSSGLATDLITFIRTPEQLLEFNNGWISDARPRMIFCSVSDKPPLRFVLAAFRAANHLAAAYIQLNTDHSFNFVKSSSAETFAIFKENLVEPVVVVSRSKIERDELDSLMWRHNRLQVPRISSSARMSHLCPLLGSSPSENFEDQSESHFRRKQNSAGVDNLCLLLLLNTNFAKTNMLRGITWLKFFMNITHDVTELLSPVYVYNDRQRRYFQFLFDNSVRVANHDRVFSTTEANLAAIENVGKVALFWRVNSRVTIYRILPLTAAYQPIHWLPHSKSEEEFQKFNMQGWEFDQIRASLLQDLTNLIEQLQSIDLRSIEQIQQTSLPDSWIMSKHCEFTPELCLEQNKDASFLLVDEFEAPLLWRIKKRIFEWIYLAYDWISKFVEDPVYFATSIVLVLVSAFIFSITSLAWSNQQAERAANSQFKATKSTRNVVQKLPLVALNSETYKMLVQMPASSQSYQHRSGTPKLLIVLCIMGQEENSRMIDQFQHYVHRYGMSNTLPATLKLSLYAPWLAHLISLATKLPTCVLGDGEQDRICIKIRPANCVGTVLVLNPSKHYFHIYHPTVPESITRLDQFSEDEAEDVQNENHLEKGTTADSVKYKDHDLHRVKQRHIFASALGFDSEDEQEDESDNFTIPAPRKGPLRENELLSHLPNWLDRLYEGQLRRIHLRHWPATLDL
ncbi:hypothetical protein Ciccas_002375 [Cichlidogyrus casuarinus]|uniref:Thioredoxin domain-containing protein n=1 Tax=Cichlidogyrus casuarinus TaxID=1844966 RepID=A0ABD2QHE1_9PLAT